MSADDPLDARSRLARPRRRFCRRRSSIPHSIRPGRGEATLPLLCQEACNLLVAEARKVVKAARHDGVDPAMIVRARSVVTMDGPPIENGAVAIQRQQDRGCRAMGGPSR